MLFQYNYQRLNSNKTTAASSRENHSPRIIVLLTLVLSSVFFFYLGRLSHHVPSENAIKMAIDRMSEQNAVDNHVTSNPYAVPMIKKEFQYERLYRSHPSSESDYAWLHPFPSGGGFFKHPTLAPRRSAFSTFHQLHFLNSIRESYWAMYSAAISDEKLNITEIPHMQSPPHVRHCVDLLRQALMCRPDLTIEEKDDDLGGVTGFGTVHSCYDWDRLVGWVKEWQNWSGNEETGRR